MKIKASTTKKLRRFTLVTFFVECFASETKNAVKENETNTNRRGHQTKQFRNKLNERELKTKRKKGSIQESKSNDQNEPFIEKSIKLFERFIYTFSILWTFLVFIIQFGLWAVRIVYFSSVWICAVCSVQLMHSFECCGELMTSKKIKCVNHEAQVPLYSVSFVYILYTKLNSCREYRIQSPEWKSKCSVYACVRKSHF